MIFNMKRNLIYMILLTQSLILSANELNPIMNQNSHNKGKHPTKDVLNKSNFAKKAKF